MMTAADECVENEGCDIGAAPPPSAATAPPKVITLDDKIDDTGETFNVMVNFIPKSIDATEFAKMFAVFGNMCNSKLIMDRVTGSHVGYGFVNYSKIESANACIEKYHGFAIDGKWLKVVFARSNSESTRRSNLYITGLPIFTATGPYGEEQVRQLFETYGKVVSVKVLMTTQEPIESRGVAFCMLSSSAEAARAIAQLNHTVPDGGTSRLSIKFADTTSGVDSTPRPRGSFGSYRGRDHSYGPMRERGGFGRGPRNEPYSGGGGPPPAPSRDGYCLFSYNLPSDMEENALTSLFQPYGMATQVKVMRDPATGRSRGFGFVSLASLQEAEAAIAGLNGTEMQGRMLKVAFKKTRDQLHLGDRDGGFGPRPGGSSWQQGAPNWHQGGGDNWQQGSSNWHSGGGGNWQQGGGGGHWQQGGSGNWQQGGSGGGGNWHHGGGGGGYGNHSGPSMPAIYGAPVGSSNNGPSPLYNHSASPHSYGGGHQVAGYNGPPPYRNNSYHHGGQQGGGYSGNQGPHHGGGGGWHPNNTPHQGGNGYGGSQKQAGSGYGGHQQPDHGAGYGNNHPQGGGYRGSQQGAGGGYGDQQPRGNSGYGSNQSQGGGNYGANQPPYYGNNQQQQGGGGSYGHTAQPQQQQKFNAAPAAAAPGGTAEEYSQTYQRALQKYQQAQASGGETHQTYNEAMQAYQKYQQVYAAEQSAQNGSSGTGGVGNIRGGAFKS